MSQSTGARARRRSRAPSTTPLLVLLFTAAAVAAATSSAEACSGRSVDLDAAECSIWLSFWDSTGGPTSSICLPGGRLDPCGGCVDCKDNHIIRIFLAYSPAYWRSPMNGTLPAAVGNLSALTALSLSNNRFSGSVPAQFSRLSALQQMDLSNNNLQGTIPASLADLKQLNTLNLTPSGLRLPGSSPPNTPSQHTLTGGGR